MNHATIAVTLTQKPVLRYTQDQTPVADFGVQFLGRSLQINLKVTVWNDLAQAVVGLEAGAVVLLQGSLGMEKMDENGVTKTYPRFTAREVFQMPQMPTGLRPQPEGATLTSVNSVQLVGRLGGDPETRFFESGSVVANASLAVNRKKKDAQPDWFPLVMWGKTAEIAGNYLHKGSEIAIEGTFDFETWKDRATGEARFKPIIRVNDLKFVGSKRQEDNTPTAPVQHVPPVPVGAVSGSDAPF